jgi:hypothetical protein
MNEVANGFADVTIDEQCFAAIDDQFGIARHLLQLISQR